MKHDTFMICLPALRSIFWMALHLLIYKAKTQPDFADLTAQGQWQFLNQ